MKSGIVLVKVDNYYTLEDPYGHIMYFTDLNADGGLDNLTSKLDSLVKNTGYGTGFFISETGQIATANHVIDRKIDTDEVRKRICHAIETVKKELASEFEELAMLHDELYARVMYSQDIFSGLECIGDYTYDYDPEAAFYLEALEERLSEYRTLYNNVCNIDPNLFNVSQHTDISIAFNDTHVTEASDFISCVQIKDDAENDLAVIQLKDKTTPSGKYIFRVPDYNPLDRYTFFDKIMKSLHNDKNEYLYLFGFNLGPSLGITQDGLKAQINRGGISQKQDSRIMYSIPALPGSSGGPVVNCRGELVAVNYAGIDRTQSFNYGVRIKFLKKLIQ